MTAPAIVHRLHQIALAVSKRESPAFEPSDFPGDRVVRLFQSLHPHDQRHLLDVHCKAKKAGLDEVHCQAALLHDVGKVTLAGTRISLWARIAHVILHRISPTAGATFARLGALGPGLRLARDHGQIGADRLRALGVSESICQIVECHDDSSQVSPQLCLLQKIDSETP